MGLPIPNLDDRRFQDLVDEARRLIPRYCPRWTDHNLSDPGITLLELFAAMVDTMIFRLNRIPEKSYITFMDLMGVQLQPPSPARVDLTFWLSRPLTRDDEPLLIPAFTEVATDPSSGGAPITFSTDADRQAFPPGKKLAVLTSPDDTNFNPIREVLGDANETPCPLFSDVPAPGDAFYLVDPRDISGHILELNLGGPIQGFGVDPEDPPLTWQAWTERGWYPPAPASRDQSLVEADETGGLNKPGKVVLHLPTAMAPRAAGGVSGYWVRCLFAPRAGQRGYSAPPQLQSLRVSTLGLSAPATHATLIFNEVIGRSTGDPGQAFRLENVPVLPRRGPDGAPLAEERIEVFVDGTWEPWEERESFSATSPRDPHYLLDGASGEVRFGPRVREPDGTERQIGAIPPAGSLIRMARYRTGGGAAGNNVGAGTLVVKKSAPPYVARVSNRRAPSGGLDAESLERARLRAPETLRTSQRAVTAEDYEHLARAAGQGVLRARCLFPGLIGAPGRPPAGTVRLLLVPAVEPPDRNITADRLSLSEGLTRAVRAYLDERRLLGTVLDIDRPAYIAVTVDARVRARRGADPAAVKERALAELHRFLNPLVGGPRGAGDGRGPGWPFGRDLYISEVYAVLQNTPGVEFIEQVTLQQDDQTGFVTTVSVPEDGLIVSGAHQVAVS